MAWQLADVTEHHYVFRDPETGAKCSVGREAMTEQEALELITPTPEKELAALKAEKVQSIKGEAQSRIYDVALGYQQMNMIARAAELNASRHERKLTVSESAEWAAIDAKWQKIKQIRQASNNAEATVSAAITIEEVNAVTW